MKNKAKIIGLCSTLFVGGVQADITLNGFANIVAGTTTSSDERLYDYDDKVNFKNGSLFALQASSDLGEGLAVTAQILSRGSDDWEPTFEWAYVSYDATDELRFLAGRQRVPFYMYSDFLDVSYAYPWITPPEGVYNVIFDTFDGLSAVYSTNVGEFDATVQVIYGSNNDDIYAFGQNLSPDFDDLMGLSLTINREWLTLRAGYLQSNISMPIQEPSLDFLYSAWTQAGFNDVAGNFSIKEDHADFLELGFQIDHENIIIIGEYTALTLDETFIADEESYYVMAGYRFDNIMIHATYGADDDKMGNFISNVPMVPELMPLIVPTAGFIESQTVETKYVTLGLRWDFHDSAALKFELTNFSDELNSNRDASLFTTALVTVF